VGELGWWRVWKVAPEVSAECPDAMESKAPGFLSKVEKSVEKRLKWRNAEGRVGVLPKFSEKNCLRDLPPAA
jgi:hypothetical protein